MECKACPYLTVMSKSAYLLYTSCEKRISCLYGDLCLYNDAKLANLSQSATLHSTATSLQKAVYEVHPKSK